MKKRGVKTKIGYFFIVLLFMTLSISNKAWKKALQLLRVNLCFHKAHQRCCRKLWKYRLGSIQFFDNIGDLYIDGLQLTRNNVQTKSYDSQGRITARYTSQKKDSYRYDSYNRMNKMVTAGGVTTTYTYSKTNENTKITASLGPAVHMKYDKYGNLLSTSTRGSDTSELFASNTYTEDGNFLHSVKDNRGYEPPIPMMNSATCSPHPSQGRP